jgi:hypothetical protein
MHVQTIAAAMIRKLVAAAEVVEETSSLVSGMRRRPATILAPWGMNCQFFRRGATAREAVRFGGGEVSP